MTGEEIPARPIRFRFDTPKATQAAAFVARLAGGSLPRSKLIKTLYDADRAQLLRTGKTITGDEPVSMEHGPVLSRIYDLIKGGTPNPTWHAVLRISGPREVVLVSDPGTDLLSPKELEMLQVSFEKFRKMDFHELRAYWHDARNCPELEEVEGTSKPIAFETMLQLHGKNEEQVNEIKALQEEDEFLSKLR